MADKIKEFLNSEGGKKLVEEGIVRVVESEPLTIEDLDDFDDLNLEIMDTETLQDYLSSLEDLQEEYEAEEPDDEEDEEYDEWEENMNRIQMAIETVQDRLDEIEVEKGEED